MRRNLKKYIFYNFWEYCLCDCFFCHSFIRHFVLKSYLVWCGPWTSHNIRFSSETKICWPGMILINWNVYLMLFFFTFSLTKSRWAAVSWNFDLKSGSFNISQWSDTGWAWTVRLGKNQPSLGERFRGNLQCILSKDRFIWKRFGTPCVWSISMWKTVPRSCSASTLIP